MKPTNKYDDIINLPHHRSEARPHMSAYDRAAQFSPFAALTGYDDAVEETARLTDEKAELTDDAKELLNAKILTLAQVIDTAPTVSITYFVPDRKKEGGAYVTVRGQVTSIDEYERVLVIDRKTTVPIDTIREIEGALW